MGYNTKEVYKGGNSLKAEDLQKKKWRVSIKAIDLAEFDDNGRTKRMLELSFNETDKTLLLNRTNSDSIEYIHGPNTDAWIGQQIILYPTLVQFQGRQVEAIRIEMPMQEEAPAAPPPQSAEQAFDEASEDPDLDPIPF